jgi:hypothetical protein
VLPRTTGRTLYAGPYKAGGVTVKLDAGTSAVPTVSPAGAGSYDGGTRKLTLSDPAAAGVSVSPDWTVDFSLAPGDPDGPTISGAVQVGKPLTASVSAPGSALAACRTVSYRWLRDGAPFAGPPHFTDDTNVFGDVAGTMGDPGLSSAYGIGVTDLGHQLAVQATCEDTTGTDAGVSVTSPPTAVVTSGFAQDQPMLQTLDGYSNVKTNSDGSPNTTTLARSGVVGDPTNPALPVFVSQLDGTGDPVDPSRLTLAVTSVTGSLSASGVAISGTGAQRSISFSPSDVGSSTVVVTLTGTTGRIATFTFTYYATMATTPSSRVLEGSSDDSSALDVGDGHFFVGDDEKDDIRLYNGEVSGREVRAVHTPQRVHRGDRPGGRGPQGR